MITSQVLPTQEYLDDSLLESTYEQLGIFSRSANFWNIFDRAFGNEYDLNAATTLQSQWQTGDFSQLPELEIVSNNLLGNANGAYAISTNKIYLSDTFLTTATTASLSAVLLEEIGHFVDAKVNQSDRPGDEGELFSALVQGKNLTAADLTRINTENDTATLWIGGRPIAIEQSGPGLTFNITFDDLAGTYSAYYGAIKSNLIAAGSLWNKYLQGTANLEVVVKFTNPGATATGRSVSSSLIVNNGTLDIYDQGATGEIRTGIDPNAAETDIEFNFNPNYLTNEMWFDPDPSARTATVPTNRTDAVSVFLHEFGHAFAFNGWKDGATGTLPGNYESTFDEKTSFDGTNLFFNGTRATSVYGSAVPLTFNNWGHLGNKSPRPGSNLLADLMNGVVYNHGTRYNISTLDLAILADIGIPVDSIRKDDGRVALSPTNGTTPIAPSSFATVSTDWQIVGTDDFSGDGESDSPWRNPDGSVALWQMNGTATNSASVCANVPTDWQIAGTGDFNDDGKSDILWRNDRGAVASWQMNGTTTSAANLVSPYQSVDHSWKIAGTSDLNGDNNSEMLWRNTAGSGDTWLMNGSTIAAANLTNPNSVIDSTWQIAAPIL